MDRDQRGPAKEIEAEAEERGGVRRRFDLVYVGDRLRSER